MTEAALSNVYSTKDLVLIRLDDGFNFTISTSAIFNWIIILLFVAVLVFLIIRYLFDLKRLRSFEIDQAEFGLGDHKITLRPNDIDRQIAYRIWVELSTRKIGLPIDLNDDVIVEVYDSWYNFFSVTRELVKDVPVNRVRRKDTERIINLSIDVLNEGLRPHLTKWQARFRRWYEKQIMLDEHAALHPQDIQKKFPDFDSLSADLLAVNNRLIKYRAKMFELVRGV